MAKEGGCVDTFCLMIDKLICGRALTRWEEGPGAASDRGFFPTPHQAPYRGAAEVTVRYYIQENSIFHQCIREKAAF